MKRVGLITGLLVCLFATACVHPHRPAFAQRTCPNYAALWHATCTHFVKGKGWQDQPCDQCVVIGENGMATFEVFPLGADPDDIDGDEGAKKDHKKGKRDKDDRSKDDRSKDDKD